METFLNHNEEYNGEITTEHENVYSKHDHKIKISVFVHMEKPIKSYV